MPKDIVATVQLSWVRIFILRATILCLSLLLLAGNSLHTKRQSAVVHAQEGGVAEGEDLSTNPKPRSTTVSASVADNEPPSTPILIAPTDGEYVTINRPSLVWKESTDNFGISHYALTLDGEVLFDDIPPQSYETSEYILTYDSATGYFSLYPKQNISDGTHTWKVTAHDTIGASTSSVTWSFTIDTRAPAFVISKIDTHTVSISAQDTSTLPTAPFELTNNQPLLGGNGEALSTVEMTLQIPGEPDRLIVFTIDEAGGWAYQLGLLPLDTIIELDFLITDPAGNVSILSDIQLILRSTPLVPSVPGFPIPPLQPGVPELPPLTTIPTQLRHQFLDTVSDFLPPSLQTYLRLGPLVTTQPAWYLLFSMLALLLIALPSLIRAVLLLSLLDWHLNPTNLTRILGLIGLWPKGNPIGIVFETTDQLGLPYCVVTIMGKTEQRKPLRQSTVTDGMGYYYHFDVPPGKYEVHASYEWTAFPTNFERYPTLTIQNFYRNEVITVTEAKEAYHLNVPVDRLPDLTSQLRIPLRSKVLRQLEFLKAWSITTFVLACLVTILVPSLINILAILLYLVAIGLRVYRVNFRKGIHGLVTTSDKEPVANAILRIMSSDTTNTQIVTQSDSNGQFSTPLRVNDYVLYVTSYGLEIATETGSGDVQAIEQADTIVLLKKATK